MKKSRFRKGQKNLDISTASNDLNSIVQSDMITLEELRSCSGFETIEKKEADEIIKSLYQLSLMTYNVINK